MKKLSLFIFLLLSIFSTQVTFTENSGFAGNTMVALVNEIHEKNTITLANYKTIQVSRRAIKDIHENEEVQCWCYYPYKHIMQVDRKKISQISHHQTTHYYTIVITKDEYYTCGDDQRFYDSSCNEYLTAKEIHYKVHHGGKVILSTWYNPQSAYRINWNGQGNSHGFPQGQGEVYNTYEFDTPNDPITLYDISLDECHNYKIGTYGFITHNMEVIAHWAFDNKEVIYEGVAAAIAGMVGQWQRNNAPTVPNPYNDNGHIAFAVPPTEQPTPPNNPNNQNDPNNQRDPGDPQKPDGSKPKNNGPTPEEIANLIAFTEKKKRSTEDDALYSLPERLKAQSKQESPNLNIQPGKQGKHIPGHNNYVPGDKKSIFTHQNPQELINKFAGKGFPDKGSTGNLGEPGYKEIVDFGEPIGYHVDDNTGALTPTSMGKIHYAKDGVHIVPYKL